MHSQLSNDRITYLKLVLNLNYDFLEFINIFIKMRIHNNPPLNIVLYEPQIPPNTGNIARLCAATKCHLILLGKLGFELSDKKLKRAGLDYWQLVSWEHLPDAETFFGDLCSEKFYFLSVHNQRPYTQINPRQGDYLFFGKETFGLPKEWMESFPERCYTLPMWEKGVRSLNLGTSVAVVVYDGLRQLGKF